ncbi:MAG: lipoyl(octanoyl) transferase LipB [Planctomycetota bacterium]
MPVSHSFSVIHAGRTAYNDALALQRAQLEQVVAQRDNSESADAGRLILTEHDPVVTVTRRPDAPGNVLVPEPALAAMGVELVETDRGGDVTYHGPGQLVCYPIVDLNRVKLRIHEYIRALEHAVIGTLDHFGIEGHRDESATGVWVHRADGVQAKVCAVGVRVRRWVAMHGLAINIDPDMDHFGLIVPCGLSGRAVTSLKEIAGDRCPSLDEVAGVLVGELESAFNRGVSRGDSR